MLSELRMHQASPMLSPYHTASMHLMSPPSTIGPPSPPMHGQLHSPLHTTAAHHHHHSQLLHHLRTTANQSAGSMGSGTLGHRTPQRSARLQPLQPAPGLVLPPQHALAAEPQYSLGLMGAQHYGGSLAEAVQVSADAVFVSRCESRAMKCIRSACCAFFRGGVVG